MTEDDDYYAFLGHFVEVFALVELRFYEYLEARTGLFDIAPAILGNIKIGDMISHIRRLERVQSIDPHAHPCAFYHLYEFPNVRQDLKKVVDQVSAINDFRNTLLHNGTWHSDSTERTTSKRSRVLAGDRVTIYKASTDTLDEMLDDLYVIADFLDVALNHLFEYDVAQRQLPESKIV